MCEYEEEIELEHQAIANYFKRFGEHAAQPSEPQIINENGKEYVVLENTYGILAVYEIENNESLKWSNYLPEGYTVDDDMRKASDSEETA